MENIPIGVIIDAFPKLKKFTENDSQPKFGVGNPEQEKYCEFIHVFMTCYGYSTVINGERRRKLMSPEDSIQDAKNHFGREVTQPIITDENGFTFNEGDTNLPISKFSNRCSLNLNFLHSHTDNIGYLSENVKNTTSNVYERIKSVAGYNKDKEKTKEN